MQTGRPVIRSESNTTTRPVSRCCSRPRRDLLRRDLLRPDVAPHVLAPSPLSTSNSVLCQPARSSQTPGCFRIRIWTGVPRSRADRRPVLRDATESSHSPVNPVNKRAVSGLICRLEAGVRHCAERHSSETHNTASHRAAEPSAVPRRSRAHASLFRSSLFSFSNNQPCRVSDFGPGVGGSGGLQSAAAVFSVDDRTFPDRDRSAVWQPLSLERDDPQSL